MLPFGFGAKMFVQLALSTPEGQIIEGIALEIKAFSIYGMDCRGGVYIDITHMDGERERMTLAGEQKPFAPMFVNEQETDLVRVVDYPACNILTKVEWRSRVGCGILLK